MPLVHSIKYALGLSNVYISRKLPKYTKKYLSGMPTFEKYVKRHGVKVSFLPSASNDKLKYDSFAKMEATVKNNNEANPLSHRIFLTDVPRDRIEIFNRLVRFVRGDF